MSTFKHISSPIKQQLLSELCERLDDAIFILDAELRYLAINAAYEDMLGYDEDFLLGRPLGIYASEFLSEKEAALLRHITDRLDSNGFYENEFVLASRYGQKINCHIAFNKTCIEATTYYFAIIRDISSAVKDRQQLTHLLNYNQLTGLANRKVFLSHSHDLLTTTEQQLVIARANIDRYRTLTNSLGQELVNNLMIEFVDRVNSLELKKLHCFAHFGGDDFGLLFECKDTDMICSELDSILQMCERPFKVKGKDIYLQISIGVSYYPQDGNQVTNLVNKAEKALHYIKQQGGHGICRYSDKMNYIAIDNLQLESELRKAINDNQFEPYYQPKIELSTGAITGFEALVRWRHPSRGLLSPKDFIDAIIRHKMSFELFCQMALQIAEQLSIWQDMGFTQYVSINADAAEFRHPEFFGFVSQLFDRYPIHPYQLHIEVTESSLMLRHANIKQQLIALKELGVCLALDDFGTGYASLSYLQEYPFDFIKVDRSFISEIAHNRTQQAIVQCILDLATALDMSAIAEGIETEQQRDLLLQMGSKYGQGYWFGRPVAAEVATTLLTESFLSK